MLKKFIKTGIMLASLVCLAPTTHTKMICLVDPSKGMIEEMPLSNMRKPTRFVHITDQTIGNLAVEQVPEDSNPVTMRTCITYGEVKSLLPTLQQEDNGLNFVFLITNNTKKNNL